MCGVGRGRGRHGAGAFLYSGERPRYRGAMFENPVDLLIRVPLVLLALTVHECAHAWVAWRMGDPTAARMGRVSLNPIRHLDPLGTICLMFAPIGWAKPVPVDPRNFRDPRMGDLLTSAAGPASNLAQALLFALAFRGLSYAIESGWIDPTKQATLITAAMMMALTGVLINVGLAVFNCLPLFPLDGFHITLQLLPADARQGFAATAPYGTFVIIGLVLVGNFGSVDILGRLILPPANLILEYVAGLQGFRL